MSVTFESIRFGTVEVQQEDVIEFPDGLIGLGGLSYTLIDRNPGTGFLWLHSVEDPALALPVVSPYQFFSTFSLEIVEEDRERIGAEDVSDAKLYVTVRATPNPLDITANLRAPLAIHEGRGYQVINTSPGAQLQAPLFTLPVQTSAPPVQPSMVAAQPSAVPVQPSMVAAQPSAVPVQPSVAAAAEPSHSADAA